MPLFKPLAPGASDRSSRPAAPLAATSRAEIEARGGHIAPSPSLGAGFAASLDVDLIVHDPKAGRDHWQAFAASRHDLLRASNAMEMLSGLQAPAGERLSLVLPSSHATAEPMQVLMDALDEEVRPTAANSVEVATLVDYFNPTAKSRWNRVLRDSKAAFEAVPVTDTGWLTQLGRLAQAPSLAVEGWADGIARHVGAQEKLRQQAALTCDAEQMRLLLTSCALPLAEDARLDWAHAFAAHHKQEHETLGDCLTRTGLNASIRWVALPAQRLKAAWEDRALNEAQLSHLLGTLKAADTGFELPTPPFGRPGGTLPQAGTAACRLTLDQNSSRRFTATLRISNFPGVYVGKKIEGPVFKAAGNSWRVDLIPEGLQLNAITGPYFAGRLRVGVYCANNAQWHDSNWFAASQFQPDDAPVAVAGGKKSFYGAFSSISSGLTVLNLCAGSSSWLDSHRDLTVRASLDY